jgi:hypothetical protein
VTTNLINQRIMNALHRIGKSATGEHGQQSNTETQFFALQAKDMAMHNYIYKLFARLKKYHQRGILIEDSPDADFKISPCGELDLPDGLGVLLYFEQRYGDF